MLDLRSLEGIIIDPGPYLARVISNIDPGYNGFLEVQLLQDVGTPLGFAASTIPVRYLSPFYGTTDSRYNSKDDTFDGTQKSYGMWMIPPDTGTLVMVIFAEGNMAKGFWIGCVVEDHTNFMTPGLASTTYHNSTSPEKINTKQVVAEYNSNSPKVTVLPDVTKIKKPIHPFQKVLEKQGLSDDETRGYTTSSARREVPSAVFGISTPGPLDKKNSAPKGPVGKEDSQANAFVSRLGGSTFVMDDGDDKFIRKGSAKDSPPNYANLEAKEKGGDPSIPHNELVRIRTRTGHQILLHNSEDLIYIGNANGTTWIELTSNGKIDIYAEDSISIHTKQDLNVTADRDVNIKAGRNFNVDTGAKINQTSKTDFNLNVGAAAKVQTANDFDLKTGQNTKITSADGSTYIWSKNNHIETALNQIHMNGPAAAQAADAPKAPKPKRVPDREPWAGHENLNPKGHTPDLTDSSDANKNPVNGKSVSIKDTFRKGE